jgi:hypothetical protein
MPTAAWNTRPGGTSSIQYADRDRALLDHSNVVVIHKSTA